jgi:uncharacterized FlaG/YvyC family protein
MEQPDQSVVRSTVQLPVETSPNVSKTRPKSVDSAAGREFEEDLQQTGNVRSVTQDHALKALGNVKLSISIDETKDLPVIKIFDSESGKELLQVPAEHSLNISRTIKAAVGAIFDKKA